MSIQIPHRTQTQIESLVQAFESATLPNSEFNHHAHLTVALWYLTRLPFVDAVTAMRTSIKHFAAAHQHDHLYHETITLFWMKLARHYLDSVESELALPELVYGALQEIGNTQLMFKHYSHVRLFSSKARQSWIEPDLMPLPSAIAE